MGKVSIARCPDYDPAAVKAAVRAALAPLGGIAAFVSPGDRVLLKPNLLIKRRPDRATTTHPSVVRAVAELVAEAGGRAVIADSPGGYYYHTAETLRGIYEACGMREAAEASGAELSWDTGFRDVSYPDGLLAKSIKVIEPVLEADKIINLPKLKTHMMNVFSGAVKNMFGIVPGRHKVEYHFRFEELDDFADVLIDINRFAKPVLNLMDAVVGMEGYGLTNGSPRQVGLILASADPFALDAVAAGIIGLPHDKVPFLRRAAERGFWSGRPEDIETAGEAPEAVGVPDFDKPTVRVAFNMYSHIIPKPILRRVNRHIKPRPVFRHDRCRGCRACAESCPAKAIEMRDRRPHVELRKCIRCYCCDELCNYDAVGIRRPWFIRLFVDRAAEEK